MGTSTTRLVDLRPDLSITLTEVGSGRPVLILHGGGGPFTVAGIGDLLRETRTVAEERARGQRSTTATRRSGAGEPSMHCPALLDRLGLIRSPVQVIWGDRVRTVPPAYGAVYAAAFADARLDIVRGAGHLPQI